MIFLDTHVIVWLYEGNIKKIPVLARELIDKEEIHLSPAVEFELELLYEIKQI